MDPQKTSHSNTEMGPLMDESGKAVPFNLINPIVGSSPIAVKFGDCFAFFFFFLQLGPKGICFFQIQMIHTICCSWGNERGVTLLFAWNFTLIGDRTIVGLMMKLSGIDQVNQAVGPSPLSVKFGQGGLFYFFKGRWYVSKKKRKKPG